MPKSHILTIYASVATAVQAVAFLERNDTRGARRISPRDGDAFSAYPVRPTPARLADYYSGWLLKGEAAVLVTMDQERIHLVQRLLREHTQALSLFVFSESPRGAEVPVPEPLYPHLSPRELRRSLRDVRPLLPERGKGPAALARISRRLDAAEKDIARVRNYLRDSGRVESSSVSVAEWGVAENAAAVTFDRWQREGRLQTAAGDHPMLDLDITRSDWEALSPKARTALQRRLARAVIRGTRVERYVIHEGATLLARSTEN